MSLFGVMLAGLVLAPAAQAQTPLTCHEHRGAAMIVGPAGPEAKNFRCDPVANPGQAGDFIVDFRFAPVASRADDPQVLRFGSVWQDSVDLKFRYADGAIAAAGFTSADASRYLQIGAIFAVPVPHRDAPLVGVRMTAKGSANLRGVVVGASLMPRSDSERIGIRLTALYAAFGGLVVSLLVYNLAMWYALRHRFQLVYCGMVAAIGLYTFSSSAALSTWFPWFDNNDRLRLNYLLLAVSGVIALAFIRSFFERGIVPRRVAWMTEAVSIGALGIALAFAVLAPRWIAVLDRLYLVGMAMLLAALIPIFWFAWRRRSRFRLIVLAALSAPIATSVARALHGFCVLPYSFWLDDGNLVALALEALLNSVLITVRLRELSSERDLAQAGERSALRLANSDPLTGLLNRRAFIDQAVGRPGVHRLLLVDIDRFKAINDRFGHDSGDQVLVGVAAVLQSMRPPGSLVVRMGGEEFALLVPVSRAAECAPADVLTRIRNTVMADLISVTASMGVAEGRLASEDDWKRLYRVADAALYRAKADGRDRFCRSTDFSAMVAA